MTLEFISAQLKKESKRFSRETLSMGPYDTANFLLLCGKILLKYVEYSNKQLEPDSQAYLSESDISKIDDLFQELGHNFFPMAHTEAPLRDLQIMNTIQFENLSERVEYVFMNFIRNSEAALAAQVNIDHDLVRMRNQFLDELQNIRTEIRAV